MANNITNQNAAESWIAANLQMPSPIEFVADVSGFKNSPLFYITSMLNKGSGTPWDYEKKDSARMGNLSILRTISNVTQAGPNLVIDYVVPAPPANVDLFRSNWIVLDSNMKTARIVKHQLGQVTVEPDGSALSFTTDFQISTLLKNGWNSSANRGSSQTETLQYVPEPDFNFASVSRNTSYFDIEDKIYSRVKMYGDMVYSSQEKLAMRSWIREITMKWLLEERNQVNGYDGARNKNGGILWANANRGGAFAQATAPYSLATLQGTTETLRSKDDAPNLNVVHFMGWRALAEIQKSLGADIKFSGQNNTFGGKEVKGINVKQYEYLDVSQSFVPMPEFNNLQGVFADPSGYAAGTKGEWSVLSINVNEVQTMGGGMAPALDFFYRGGSPFFYGHIPGMAEAGKNANIENFEAFKSSLVVSDKPGRSALMYSFSGIDMQDAKGTYYHKG